MAGMASSVTASLILFMSYPNYRAKDGDITNTRSSNFKASPAELAVTSWLLLHSVRVSQSITQTSLVFMPIYLYDYKWHNRPFYKLNRDSVEYVTQVKQGHRECLASMFVKYDITFRRFPIKPVAYLSMWDSRKDSFFFNWNWF